jgi:hypothetical protein
MAGSLAIEVPVIRLGSPANNSGIGTAVGEAVTSNNPQLMEDTTMKRLIAKSLLVLTAVERRCSGWGTKTPVIRSLTGRRYK